MIEYTTRLVTLGANAYRAGSPTFTLEKPKDSLALDRLYAETALKTDCYVTWRMSLPHRPRTTGWKSQNHRINGFIQQMAVATGNDFDALKMLCKKGAIGEGYPFQTLPNGEVWPKSEAGISVEEATILINTIQRLAAEYNIPLKEE